MQRQVVPRAVLTSGGVAAAAAFELWRESISSIFVVEPLEEERFRFESSTYDLGTALIARTRLGAQRFRRSARDVRTTGIDHYLLQVYLSGGFVGEAGRTAVTVKPGNVCFLDLGRTVTTQAVTSTAVSVLLPREALDRLAPGVERLHGQVLPEPIGGILGDVLQSAYRRLDRVPLAQAPIFGASTLAVVAALLALPAACPAEARPALADYALGRAKRFIESNLTSPKLTPDAIASAAFVSRATLYRLFRPLGGVAAYVRARRLEAAYAALVRAPRQVQTVAHELGFTSEAHFSRAFRRRFGESPREARAIGETERAVALRRTGLSYPNRSGRAGHAGLDQWVRDLQARSFAGHALA
ncbi:helix-turn-helix domain-containing protein [Mangrovicella endophytica]|uniref:helix-turn-helix domain-containing protein n=1 Tax=Mangrovicella endophytica TaxID=2066697 RepID=UPI000C9DD0AC|nr:helix-turn-helix domain-containing protein [Mangrovicella endophytica]